MNTVSFYLSMLKFSISHPQSGKEILKSMYQSWDDSKHKVLIPEQTTMDINESLNFLFPESEVSLHESKQKLLPLQDHIKKFFEELNTLEYPSTQKPYPTNYSLDDQAGMFLYVLCKIVKPDKVVETGVAYGLSSVYILQALHENQKGKLYSIDYVFRPWQSKEMIGKLIPEHLKNRWQLIFGTSSNNLKKLLTRLESTDIFIHDSLHTYANMKFEFETAWPFIRKGGFLLSDDVLSNNAFYHFSSSKNLKPIFLSQKGSSKSLMGILRKL